MSISSKSSFVIAIVLLSICAVGLEGATRFLKLHFRKEAVPLAQLLMFSSGAGPPGLM